MTWISRIAVIVVVFAASLAAVGVSRAASGPKQFLVNINAGQETPPNGSNGFGVAHLTFDDATKMLCYSISFSGLGSAEILAHIHGPAVPGVAGAILFPLPLGSPKGGCVGPLDGAQKANLLKNLLYVNIHTVGFPGGELRGQILRIK